MCPETGGRFHPANVENAVLHRRIQCCTPGRLLTSQEHTVTPKKSMTVNARGKLHKKKLSVHDGECGKGYLFFTDPQSQALAENDKGGEHLPKGIALTF